MSKTLELTVNELATWQKIADFRNIAIVIIILIIIEFDIEINESDTDDGYKYYNVEDKTEIKI